MRRRAATGPALFRQVGIYTGDVLTGEKPGDPPSPALVAIVSEVGGSHCRTRPQFGNILGLFRDPFTTLIQRRSKLSPAATQ
jgi:hypothetical protein